LYNKPLYYTLISLGILFYVLSVFQLYNLVSIFQNETIPLLDTLSTMRFNLRVQSLNITNTTNGLKVSSIIILNITWSKKVNLRGPILEIIWKNKSIAKINITRLNKPVINKKVYLSFIVSNKDLSRKFYLGANIISRIGSLRLVQPIFNASTILQQVRLGIENLHIERIDDKNYLVFNITSYSSTIKTPINIKLLDEGINTLKNELVNNFSVSPRSKFEVRIDVTGIDYKSIKYIEIDASGLRIALFKLGG
jgi:hypothetical protein